MRQRWFNLFLLACLVATMQPLAWAQPGEETSENKVTSTDSPRFMVRQFMDVIRRNDVDAALVFVEFPRKMSVQRQKNLVNQLVTVLNKRGQIDLAQISDNPSGQLADGLMADAEIIGQVKVEGEVAPIELRRTLLPDEEKRTWRFAAEFMEKVPHLAERLQEHEFEQIFPPMLVEYSGLGIKVWQWLGLLLAVLIGFLTSSAFAFILIKLINVSSRHFNIYLSDRMLKRLVPPLRWITGLFLFRLGVSWLELTLDVRQSIRYFENMVLALAVAFLLMRLVEAVIEISRLNFERQGKVGAGGMLQPVQKGAKVLIVVCAAIWMFRGFGFDVTAILAGLGVGGLAIALAGQKTLENLFGGISVLLDQPVRVGDTGRFGEIVGSVEEIGLRSTKVRTLDRTLVTIPNAEFSLMKIENFERRDKIRWTTILGLRYETDPEQMRLVLMRLKELLIGHPKVLNEPARVRLIRLGASSLDVEIFCFISTGDNNEYLAVVEDLNLKILSIVKACGSGFAFPSSTIYLERSGGLDPEAQGAAIAEARQIQATTGFPQPAYPPEWAEPRQDILVYGPK